MPPLTGLGTNLSSPPLQRVKNSEVRKQTGNTRRTSYFTLCALDGSVTYELLSRSQTLESMHRLAVPEIVLPTLLGFVSGVLVGGIFQLSDITAPKTTKKNITNQIDQDQELPGRPSTPGNLNGIEQSHWLNKVVKATWPYLDAATSTVIVNALDRILKSTRPSFLTSIQFERFSFGSVPATIQGVKVYDSEAEGALEIDLQVSWVGDPDVVLKIRAAQDALAVPVSLTEFSGAFTLRLIFAPLIGVFPCFGALTIALTEDPEVNFDLRVVGGDITLLPGLAQPLQTYIQALIASFLVWPRCITVPIPGTGYSLPVFERVNAGLLHVEFHSHDDYIDSAAEMTLRIRWPGDSNSDTHQQISVGASSDGRFVNPREVTLSVEDVSRQFLTLQWYSNKHVAYEIEDEVAFELVGETSILLDDIFQAPSDCSDSGFLKYEPITMAVELEPVNFCQEATQSDKSELSVAGRLVRFGSTLLSKKTNNVRASTIPTYSNLAALDANSCSSGARIVQITLRYQSMNSMKAA